LIPIPLRSISTVGTIEESVVSVIFACSTGQALQCFGDRGHRGRRVLFAGRLEQRAYFI
jgi:hypothetical protein